ncbi:MAG: DUF5615 family PIN-like protein [Verrucomicrobiota bacterium]
MLLLDHNLSPRLIEKLEDEFGKIDHVQNLGMADGSDIDIWEFAKAHGYSIVTKDKDFYERSTVVGQPPKVIHLTLGNCSVADCVNAILNRSGQVKDFLQHSSKAYLVLL